MSSMSTRWPVNGRARSCESARDSVGAAVRQHRLEFMLHWLLPSSKSTESAKSAVPMIAIDRTRKQKNDVVEALLGL